MKLKPYDYEAHKAGAVCVYRDGTPGPKIEDVHLLPHGFCVHRTNYLLLVRGSNYTRTTLGLIVEGYARDKDLCLVVETKKVEAWACFDKGSIYPYQTVYSKETAEICRSVGNVVVHLTGEVEI